MATLSSRMSLISSLVSSPATQFSTNLKSASETSWQDWNNDFSPSSSIAPSSNADIELQGGWLVLTFNISESSIPKFHVSTKYREETVWQPEPPNSFIIIQWFVVLYRNLELSQQFIIINNNRRHFTRFMLCNLSLPPGLHSKLEVCKYMCSFSQSYLIIKCLYLETISSQYRFRADGNRKLFIYHLSISLRIHLVIIHMFPFIISYHNSYHCMDDLKCSTVMSLIYHIMSQSLQWNILFKSQCIIFLVVLLQNYNITY